MVQCHSLRGGRVYCLVTFLAWFAVFWAIMSKTLVMRLWNLNFGALGARVAGWPIETLLFPGDVPPWIFPTTDLASFASREYQSLIRGLNCNILLCHVPHGRTNRMACCYDAPFSHVVSFISICNPSFLARFLYPLMHRHGSIPRRQGCDRYKYFGSPNQIQNQIRLVH